MISFMLCLLLSKIDQLAMAGSFQNTFSDYDKEKSCCATLLG